MAPRTAAAQALRDKNLANQQAFAEAQKGVSATVTPAVADIGGQPAPVTVPAAPVTPLPNVAPAITPASSVPAVTVPEQQKILETPSPAAPAPAPTPTSGSIYDVPAPIAAPAAVAPVPAPVPAKEPVFMTETQREAKLGQVDQQASRDQMIANVGIMAKEDPTVNTDRAKFDAKTGYVGKSPEERAILDAYFTANAPKTAEDLRKQIQAGVTISNPKITNTPQYRQAKFEQDRLSKYARMTPDQLFNEMKSGLPTNISNQIAGTPAYQEALAKYDQYKKVDNINNASEFMATGKSREKDPLAELSNQLAQIFGQQDETGSTAEAYKAYISNNPEITWPTLEYNQKMAQKKEFERAREALVNDLKKQYAGEPLSTILSIAARQSEPINQQINSLNDSLNTLAADVKFHTDMATNEFGFYTKDQEAKAAKQAKLQDLLGGLAVSEYQTGKNQKFELQKMDIQNKYQADRDVQNYVQDLQKMGIANAYDLQNKATDREFQKELLALNQKYENSRSVRDFNNDIKKIGFQFGLQEQGKALDLKNSMALEDYKSSLDPDKAEKWQAIADKATENSSLADLYGKNVGTYTGNRGYDLAGKLGDAIVAPPGARVVEVRSLNDDGTVSLAREWEGAMSTKDVGYGNSVVLQLPDGKFMRLSHLNSIDVPLGSDLAGGQMLGTRGNTGNVKGRNGETLTDEQKAAGRGAHVDVEISNDSSFKGNSLLSQAEQLAYLKSVKPFGKWAASAELTNSDIETFNNPTFKPADIKKADVKAKYEQYVEAKNKVKTDKNTSIDEILRFSAGGKDLGAEEAKSLAKYDQALGQIAGLQEGIKTIDTGPILGRLRSLNPYDTPVQTLKAQLNALIPNLARGVYGEVGVLTDADIANYSKTIPNLASTDDVNKAVLAMTLDTIAGGYKKQLRTLAAAGRDVSGFVSLYDEIKSQADSLKSELGIEGGQNQGLDLMGGSSDSYLQSLWY